MAQGPFYAGLEAEAKVSSKSFADPLNCGYPPVRLLSVGGTLRLSVNLENLMTAQDAMALLESRGFTVEALSADAVTVVRNTNGSTTWCDLWLDEVVPFIEGKI